MEWLNTHIEYWHWIVLGLVLAGIEIFAPSFFMLWLGISAILVGLIMSVTEISFTLQVFIWAAASFTCLLAWFKFISPMMKDKSLSGMSKEAILGQEGTVLHHSMETNRGMMRFPAPILGNDEWNIISDDELTGGDRVVVKDVVGNSLSVKKKK